MVEGRSGITIVFAEIKVQETAQRPTMPLMPQMIIKMTNLTSVKKKNTAKDAQICVKINFLSSTVTTKTKTWCSSAHCLSKVSKKNIQTTKAYFTPL
jgi:hypothetical protein